MERRWEKNNARRAVKMSKMLAKKATRKARRAEDKASS
jgi:hypothetical protein